MCRESGDKEFNYGERMVTGEWCIPLELKVLSVLRCLGSGLQFMDLSEMTGNLISESECSRFFKVFVAKFRDYFQHLFIKPLEGEDLARAMREYSMLGLPGCVGSIDCTFVGWDRVSANLKNLYNGDKGQGVLFEVIVTHFKKIVHVGNSIPGTINDKTSVKYSEFVTKLRNKELYDNVSYRLYTSINEQDCITLSNCYLICDGGYLEWPELITGFGASGDPVKYKFSDWVASVRKDVECCFGILKARFRFLKNVITLQKREDVENAFFVCCILHNLILECDGLDSMWESDINWKNANPEFEEDEEEIIDNNNGNQDLAFEFQDPNYDVTIHDDNDQFQPMYAQDLLQQADMRTYEQDHVNFQHLQLLLANNLHYMYRLGKLRWPKVRNQIEGDDNNHNHLPRIAFPNAGDLVEVEEDQQQQQYV